MALTLCGALILLGGAVGISIQSLVKRDVTLREWLQAPAVGMAAFVSLLTILSVAGLPVRTAAPIVLALCASVIAVAVASTFRPAPDRGTLVVLATLLIGAAPLLLPLLLYGYDWISFANDDMANYVLSAMRFLDHGYFEIPPIGDVVLNRNLPLDEFSLFVVHAERTGSELLLAAVMAIGRVDGFAAYMPTTVAAQVALVGATAALASHAPRPRAAAAAAVVLMSLSPMAIYPVVYQLLPQVLGGAFLVAFAAEMTLLLVGRARKYRTGAMAGLLLSATVLTYPEVFLIAVPPLAVAAVLAFRRGAIVYARETLTALVVVLAAVLNTSVVRVAVVLFNKSATGHGLKADPSSFLDYLLPSGLPMFFGLIPMSVLPGDPALSILIVAGALCLGALVWQAIRIAHSDNAIAAWQLLAYSALFVMFFVTRQTYSGFKARFYAEPFLIVVVALVLARTRARYATVAVAVIALAWLPTDVFVIGRSIDAADARSSAYTTLNHATTTHVIRTVGRVIGGADGTCILSAALANSLAKIEGANSVGRMILYSSHDPMALMIAPASRADARVASAAVRAWSIVTTRARRAEFAAMTLRFPGTSAAPSFSYDLRRNRPECVNAAVPIIIEGRDLSVINRSYTNRSPDAVDLFGSREPRALLLYIDSSLGVFANFAATGATLFTPEPDYFRPSRSFSAVGRYLLFEVAGSPLRRVRLAITSTSTLNGDGANRIPTVTIFGRTRATIAAIGRGAAYRISDPVEPLVRDGHSYLLVDFGPRRLFTRQKRSGLMNAYGRDVQIDPRDIRTFVRDISVLPAADDRSLRGSSGFDARSVVAPVAPFSGIYEDGWLSEASMFVLQAARDDAALRLDIEVPEGVLAPHQAVDVLVDGRRVSREPLSIGDNSIIVGHFRRGRRSVALNFAEGGPLSASDVRPASALLKSIRFE